jgi:amino acid adenylation domain-containing protein/FkbH-like protein
MASNSELADRLPHADSGLRGQHVVGERTGAAAQATLAIAATFTADLMRAPLEFWMKALEIPIQISFAPYAQVMQELLSPASGLAGNKNGFNVLLFRLEDWLRDRRALAIEQNCEHLRRGVDELVHAIGVLRGRSAVPLLVFLPAPSGSLDSSYTAVIKELHGHLRVRLSAVPRVRCWEDVDLMSLYRVEIREDPHADRIAHVPYTEEYFAAIATLLARHVAVSVKPPYKVIALDCDNTLWKGICGEDGAAGIELTPAHIELQRMLLRQYQAGVLLCLCSKNNAADVEAVFAAHTQMPLREEHLICSRVNWNAKSANLQSLAEELGLALDSFIFIDDNAVECAEVRTHCPAVLTLQLPGTQQEIMEFVRHVWAFDRLEATDEARQRTLRYKQNRARAAALEQAADLDQFLTSLELQTDVAPMQDSQLPRVAELVQRTNQFNLTGIRRREAEIEQLSRSGEVKVLVVHVRDRFGDYGLVGAVLYRLASSALEVDTFVLSCRVLGRRVEHKIVNALGRLARAAAARSVVLRYKPTARNVPARLFLQQILSSLGTAAIGDDAASAEMAIEIPLDHAEALGRDSLTGDDTMQALAAESRQPPAVALSSPKWHEAAYRLRRLSDLMSELARVTPKSAREVNGEFVAPRSPQEEAVARIWAEHLGLDEVGVFEDFLDLGGDSLRAVQVLAALGTQFDVELSIYEFFEEPTVAGVARRLASATSGRLAIERVSRSGALPLSSAQKRLWFIDQLEGGSPAYHIPLALRLSGELDCVALESALNGLVTRHEVLRTTYLKQDGEPMQRIAEDMAFALPIVDLRGLRDEQRERVVYEQAREEQALLFDLGAGPLIRGRLLRLSAEEHVLLITMHHIVSDGWSIGVLVRELGALYGMSREGPASGLSSLPIQYADYAVWHRQWLAGPQFQEQIEYWKQQLQGAAELIELPADRPRPPVQSYKGAGVPIALGPELSAQLKAFAREHDLTLAMTLYAAWSIVLARLSGQGDVVVGMPVANRRRSELEGLIGFFVNTLAVRICVDGELSVREFLDRVRSVLVGAYAHQDVPFEEVVEALRPARSLSYSPLFQVVFVLQNAPRDTLQIPGLTLTEHEVPTQTAQFDLSLSLRETEQGIDGTLNYATDLFDVDTVRRWSGYFAAALREIVRRPDAKVGALELLDEAERQRLISAFNATDAPCPEGKLIHDLFATQALRTPDAPALVTAVETLSYAELNRRANRLARHLRDLGANTGEYVPTLMARSIQLVVAQLAILKAGAVYLPIDPTLPAERKAFMIRDCAARFILVDGAAPHEPVPEPVRYVDCTEANLALSAQGCSDLALVLEPPPPAYVMYTSGSTGIPKGVVCQHRGVIRLAINNGYARIGPDDCIAHHSNPTFDASTFEIWTALLNGARVLIVPQEVVLEASRFRELLRQQRVTAMYLSVGLFNQYVDDLAEVFSRLRYLLVGGDSLEPSTIRRVLCKSPPAHLMNVYGPTECTTFATRHLITAVGEGAIPIGKPISNTRIYILERSGAVAPTGAPGEIFIGGAAVARGYLNRPELSEQRFVHDPFDVDPAARMYRTGDLARWRVDGTIEFLGRNDQQVKIRGFRIELGEIEAHLLRHSRIKEAVVTARDEGSAEKRLIAYVAARDSLAVTAEELSQHLKAALPEYMVPSVFVLLDRLPLTPTGKLDRRALPEPSPSFDDRGSFEPPRGEVEEILATIWQSLLRVERVGRSDNFFQLGGHSLLIVQMMARLRRLGLSAEVRRVFESPTLSTFAAALTASVTSEQEVPPNLIPADCQVITPEMLTLIELTGEQLDRIAACIDGGMANIEDIYPLAPLQEGILFHHLLDPRGGDPYVLPTLLAVASRERADELIAALQKAIDRHAVLRTAVLWEGLPQPVQVVHRRARLPVQESELATGASGEAQITDWLAPERQRLDLRSAPLLRAHVLRDRQSGRCNVLLQLHHIIADGQSLRLLMSEVMKHLEGRVAELQPAVPYRNHVAQALAYARTHDAEALFRGKLKSVDEPTAPFGLLDVHGDATRLEEFSQAVSPELAQDIRAQARRHGVSAATLLHAAWALAVAQTTDQEDVVFGTVLLGRLQGTAGAQRIPGMFINTLPMRLSLRNVSAQELIERTQRELVELLTHEQASLAVARRCSSVLGSTPLFSALLNYRHRSRDAEWSNAEGVEVIASHGFTNYPITLSVDDLGDGFTLVAQTDRRIDPRLIAEYLLTTLQCLVDALKDAAPTPVLDLALLPESERAEVIEKFNATRAAYDGSKLVHELFEAQAALTPKAAAVVHADRSLTYEELNRRANRLARHLEDNGVGRGGLVGICLERSPEMVVGLLAILKAGAAYVPLDPSYPRERLQQMLDDASPSVVLTQEQLRDTLPLSAATAVALDDVVRGIEELSSENLLAAERGLSSSNLVYVIYTSGSTGRPKGTAMPHGAMVNLLQWHRAVFGDGAGFRVLQFAALSFDVAFQETFSTLCTGGTLVLLDEWVRRDARALLELLNGQCVARLFVPPLMLQSLAEYCKITDTAPHTLRDVITAGEQLRISPEIRELFSKLGECRLHNHYGPTETHVVTALALQGDPHQWPALPTIGAPIANSQIYILNRRRQAVPRGVIGEIYIAGANVAQGYLRRPELTEQRFVPDPFHRDSQTRMYRTGDLGRWRSDGSIEYLGRNDDQVKIRGYRIELGEIELRLAAHEAVKEAAVLVREDVPGEKRLVAYLTCREGSDAPGVEKLRAHLKKVLPEYMVPAAFVALDRLPLTPSGKLNRRALPKPESDAYVAEQYEPPQGELEQALAGIWRDLLHVDRIGRDDNFFELGGHSLLAMQVMTRIQGLFAIELPIRKLFEFTTLRTLALHIEEWKRVHSFGAAEGEGDFDKLLETVAAMSDNKVRELMNELTTGGRS